MMKSLEIIIFFPSIEGGGADKNLFMISNFLSKKFSKISIVTSSNKYRKKFNNINFIGPASIFWGKFGRKLKTLISVIYLIKAILFKKDIIVFSFQSNIISIIICKLLFKKIITRSNSFPNDWTKNPLKKLIFKKVYQLADKTIVNSLAIKKKFNFFYKINPIHIYNPVDKSRIIGLSKKTIKNIYKNKKSLKIIIVGRLSKEKDHITFLKSLKILNNKIKFEALILGSGVYKEKIKRFILQNKLQNNVKLIKFKSNPYPYIYRSDILILSSLHEGLPNVLIEAAVLKTLCISTNCETGPKEILLNGKAGSLFKIQDEKDLSKKIIYFYKNKDLSKKLINTAYKNINRFDFNQNLNQYFETIKN